MGTAIEPLKEDAKIAGRCVLYVKWYGVYILLSRKDVQLIIYYKFIKAVIKVLYDGLILSYQVLHLMVDNQYQLCHYNNP